MSNKHTFPDLISFPMCFVHKMEINEMKMFGLLVQSREITPRWTILGLPEKCALTWHAR